MSTVPPHEAVRNLLGTYCELLDAGRLEEVAGLFEHAVLTDDDGRRVAQGREGTLRLLRGTLHLHGGSPRTRHLTTNSIIEVDEEQGTAAARSAYVVLQATDSLALQPIIAGRYRDRFERVDDGGRVAWRFVERAFAVDLVGDLSHHMRYEVPPS